MAETLLRCDMNQDIVNAGPVLHLYYQDAPAIEARFKGAKQNWLTKIPVKPLASAMGI